MINPHIGVDLVDIKNKINAIFKRQKSNIALIFSVIAELMLFFDFYDLAKVIKSGDPYTSGISINAINAVNAIFLKDRHIYRDIKKNTYENLT